MKDHHRPCDLYTEKDTLWFLWHACQKKNAYLWMNFVLLCSLIFIEHYPFQAPCFSRFHKQKLTIPTLLSQLCYRKLAIKIYLRRDFPGGRWLYLHFPVQGAKVCFPIREVKSHMAWRPERQNLKQKQYYNKFNKDFKNGPH